jgi:hypothetical protein
VWVRILILEDFGILSDWGSSIEDSSLDVWHVLAESSVFVLDLVGQFASVAHNQDRGLASDWFDLLKSGEDEDSSLTKTRFGLAEDIGTENCLRDTNLLDCRVEPMLDKVLQVFMMCKGW